MNFIDRLNLVADLTETESSRLRRWLVRFLRAKGAREPEESAHETLVRILKNLRAGLQIRNLDAYASRVAQNVLREDLRHSLKHSALPEDLPENAAPTPDNKVLLKCLEVCKHTCLVKKELRLIEAYYGGTIADRKSLARKEGLSENALRLRAFKVRQKLKACVEHCCEKS